MQVFYIRNIHFYLNGNHILPTVVCIYVLFWGTDTSKRILVWVIVSIKAKSALSIGQFKRKIILHYHAILPIIQTELIVSAKKSTYSFRCYIANIVCKNWFFFKLKKTKKCYWNLKVLAKGLVWALCHWSSRTWLVDNTP